MPSLVSQISFALTGLVAHANHLFYRFRTVFRVLYVIRPWYESCVRPVSPSDLLLVERTCVRSASALVVLVLYSESFRHRFVIIRLLSFKIHIRYSYENFYSIFSVISVKLIGGQTSHHRFRYFPAYVPVQIWFDK